MGCLLWRIAYPPPAHHYCLNPHFYALNPGVYKCGGGLTTLLCSCTTIFWYDETYLCWPAGWLVGWLQGKHHYSTFSIFLFGFVDCLDTPPPAHTGYIHAGCTPAPPQKKSPPYKVPLPTKLYPWVPTLITKKIPCVLR